MSSGNKPTDFKFIESWCGGRDSNPQAIEKAQDFKSCVSTSSTTPARRVDVVCQRFVTLLFFNAVYKQALL